MGITKIRTTAYHPQANRMVERSQRSLKTALICRGNTKQCVSELPSVSLGLLARLKHDTQCSTVEIIYEETLTSSGDFFESSTRKISDNEILPQELRKRKFIVICDTIEKKTTRKDIYTSRLQKLYTCIYPMQ